MIRDLVFGGVSLALAIGYYLLAAGIPVSQLDDTVGAQGLPRIYALLLGALSVVLIVRAIGAGRSKPGTGGTAGEARGSRSGGLGSGARAAIFRPLGVVAIGLLYVAAVPSVGYLLSLAGLLAATIWYQGGGMSRRVAAVAIVGALGFWLLFVALLGIQHPAGIWPELF